MGKKSGLTAGVIIGVIIAFYIGSLFDFFPFFADNYTIRAIGFCTLIICIVIAVCTNIILSDKKD